MSTKNKHSKTWLTTKCCPHQIEVERKVHKTFQLSGFLFIILGIALLLSLNSAVGLIGLVIGFLLFSTKEIHNWWTT